MTDTKLLLGSKSIIAGFLVLVLLSGCVQKPAEMQPFSPEGGGFSIMLPGEPINMTTTVNTTFGPAIMHDYLAFDFPYSLDKGYFVDYKDYPEAVKDADPQIILDKEINEAVARVNGTIISEAPLTLNGYPGKEVNISTGKQSIRARKYLVGNRLYTVGFIGPADELDDSNAEEMLISFKLTSSQSIRDICAREDQFKCIGACMDGFGETCYYDSTQYNGDDLNMGLHTLPEETKAACMGLHSYAVCGSCFNRFELRKNGVLMNVSCEEFHQAIADENQSCGGCVKKATAGCC